MSTTISGTFNTPPVLNTQSDECAVEVSDTLIHLVCTVHHVSHQLRLGCLLRQEACSAPMGYQFIAYKQGSHQESQTQHISELRRCTLHLKICPIGTQCFPSKRKHAKMTKWHKPTSTLHADEANSARSVQL